MLLIFDAKCLEIIKYPVFYIVLYNGMDFKRIH